MSAEDKPLLVKLYEQLRVQGLEAQVHMLDLKVREGQVTVNGNVDSKAVQALVVEALRALPGVAAVDDQLSVRYRSGEE